MDLVLGQPPAVAAAASAAEAAASATAAAASFDAFDDRFLGVKAVDPTLDNDGNALLAGALYFSSSAGKMRVYSGSAWQDVAPVAASLAASAVTVTPTGGIASTTAQAALAELDTEKVPTTRSVSTGAGLTGGGDLSANRTLSVPNDGITNTMLANMAANTIKGNNAGATGDPLDLTAAQVAAILPALVGDAGAGGTKGLVPTPAAGDAAKCLKGDGTWGTLSPGYAPGDTVINDGGQLEVAMPIRFISGNYTVTTADRGWMLNAIGASTVTLPTGAAAGDKFVFAIKNSNAPGTNITLQAQPGENIDGLASITLTVNNSFLVINNASPNWRSLCRNPILNDTVTNALLSDMAANTIKGNNAGATGDPLDLTAAQVAAILPAVVGDAGAGGTQGLVPAPAAGDAAAGKVLRADGAWATTGASLTTASNAETLLGTDATKAVTPDALAALWEEGAPVAASGGVITVGEGGFFHVTAVGTISDIDFGTTKGGRAAILVFDNSPSIFHNSASLILPGGANITAAPGDCCLAVAEDATDAVRVVWYQRASGKAVLAPGVVQVVNSQNGFVATGTTQIPLDDTIPQITEGDEYLSATITPAAINNKLKIEVTLNFALSGIGFMTAAIFQDAQVNALAAGCQTVRAAADPMSMTLMYFGVASGSAATTFRVRAGPSTALTMTLNGFSSARKLGGVMASSITITEIKP